MVLNILYDTAVLLCFYCIVASGQREWIRRGRLGGGGGGILTVNTNVANG
jgi:hypothetical protein